MTLVPFDIREAIPIKEAAHLAGKSGGTIRLWCEEFGIGRRVGGGNWMVSKVALQMHLDGARQALSLYRRGDRQSDSVVAYFERVGLLAVINDRTD